MSGQQPPYNDGPWKWAVLASLMLKVVTKLMQFWRWRDAVERRLREDMLRHNERLSGQIGELRMESARLRETNERQQREIDELKRRLLEEQALKEHAEGKLAETRAELHRFEAKVAALEASVNNRELKV